METSPRVLRKPFSRARVGEKWSFFNAIIVA